MNDVPACGNCNAYRPAPKLDQEAAARIERAGMGVKKGQCRCFPEVVLKAEDEWCRQHQPAK